MILDSHHIMQSRLTRDSSGLDVCRLLLSIFVIWVHSLPWGSLSFTDVIDLARCCMGTFLVISGYLLYRKISTSTSPDSYLNNYITRILTIYLAWAVVYQTVSTVIMLQQDIPVATIIYDGLLGLLLNGTPGNAYQMWYLYLLIFTGLYIKIAMRLTRHYLPLLLTVTLTGRVAGYLCDLYLPGTLFAYIIGLEPLRFIFGSGYYIVLGMIVARYQDTLSENRIIMTAVSIPVSAAAFLAPSIASRLVPALALYWILQSRPGLSARTSHLCRYYSRMLYYSHVLIYMAIGLLMPALSSIVDFTVCFVGTILFSYAIRLLASRHSLLRLLYSPTITYNPA